MKFTIKKQILLENLNYVSKALSSRTIIPILSGIKLSLTANELILEATDDDLTIKTKIDKKKIEAIEETGSIVVYGRYLLDIVRKLPDDIINIQVFDGFKFIISSANSKFDLNGMNEKEFPQLNLDLKSNFITISSNLLKEIVNQTSFASSTQESRPIITGINFSIKDDNLECVATDSFRLAKKRIKLNESFNEEVNVVIPSRNLVELIKILNEDNQNVELHIFNNKIIFKFDEILFQSRLLNGSYPDVSARIPEKFNFELQVKYRDLYNALDRASLLTSEKEKNVIKLEISGVNGLISSNIPEIGKVEEKLIFVNEKKEDLAIAFSSKYILEALKSFQQEDIIIHINSELEPFILMEKDNNNLIQLIVPIKTY